MSETQIQREIQVALSEQGARLFRNSVALAWVGELYKPVTDATVVMHHGDVLLRNARPIQSGFGTGSSDLLGWSGDGRFLACEAKSETGRLRPEQAQFIRVVNEAGGLAFMARSANEAVKIYNELVNPL